MRNVLVFTISFSLLIGFASSTNVEDEYGARPLGMGRAFVGVADDGYASMWNPAGMDFFKDRTLTAMFSRLYWGIDNDVIGQGFLAYTHHWDRIGSAGLSVCQLFSVLWRETRVNVSYGKAISEKISLGLNLRLLRNEIVKPNVTYTRQPGDDANNIVDPHQDPLFTRNGWSKMGFTGDFSTIFKLDQSLTLGVIVSNITQPDMSFAGIGKDGKEPLTIRAGGSYWIRDRLLPALDIRFVNTKINGKMLIRPHLGLEYWMAAKTVALRTGLNPEEYSFGFSYRSRRALDLQVDYAFIYPLSDIRLTGATSHKLSATLRFAPPEKPLFDIALKTSNMKVYPQNAIINESVTITALVENLGERPVSEYQVALYYENPTQGWVLANPVMNITEKLSPGETKEITWTWTPPGKGHYQLFATVDDDGTMIPALNGKIPEIDEENNKGFVEFNVFPLPEGKVSPQETKLEVSQVVLIREEEPIVPVVFFDPSDKKVDSRFHKMLEVISKRLITNPDIVVKIYGFYNPESDGDMPGFGEKLAGDRANAVKSIILKYSPEVRDRVIVEEPAGYDASFHRSGLSEKHFPDDRPRAEAENRRAELRAEVRGFEKWEPTIYFEKNSAQVDQSALSALKNEAMRIKEVMERNSEVIFLIEGFAAGDEIDPFKLSFDRAYNIKQALANILGGDFVKRFANRVFIRGNTEEKTQRGLAKIGISGESLIFRPMEGEWTAKDYEIQQDQTNFVKITSNVEAGVQNYRVSIIDNEGNVFKTLTEGTGNIPPGVPWDWRDAAGNLIDPHKTYYVELDITDKLGQKFSTRSEPIQVEVTKRTQEIETLILVQFVFDEDISESKFLESRVEYVARKFIEKAMTPKKRLLAEVGGHTDVIGTKQRNNALSLARARKEEQNLRRYLIYLLGLKDNNELNRWLAQHNTELRSAGYADTKSYIITKWEGGELKQKQIGNNDLPEGRTINRRVVVEFYMEKEGSKEATTEQIPPQSMR